MEEACRRAGRNPAEVLLVAVSKTFDAAAVAEAAGCGVADFGENYVQELTAKRGKLDRSAIRWHFIGHLQSNKVRKIAGWVDAVHALDSAAIARTLGEGASAAGRIIQALIEVNTSGEATKFGVRPEEAAGLAREVAAVRGLRLTGFMTMGPLSEDPADARRSFRALRRVRDDLGAAGLSLPDLSMGMTADFEAAIEEGATIVRVGSAIFGPRTARSSPTSDEA
jgi:pyridoxal phosphate enzyme (YggS family)